MACIAFPAERIISRALSVASNEFVYTTKGRKTDQIRLPVEDCHKELTAADTKEERYVEKGVACADNLGRQVAKSGRSRTQMSAPTEMSDASAQRLFRNRGTKKKHLSASRLTRSYWLPTLSERRY